MRWWNGTTIENINQNDEKYLIPDHPEISSATVKTFAIDINAVFSGYNVQESLIDDVFSVLQKHLPGVLQKHLAGKSPDEIAAYLRLL